MKLIILLCIFSKIAAYTRIIGGQTAYTGQFPFAAGIEVRTSDSAFFCGGALLDNDWIITAAQCVDNAILFTIHLGSTSLTADDPNRVTLATSTYFLHPDYNPATLANDIGLIKLRIPIQFTRYIQPIHTLSGDHIPGDTRLMSVGWGQTGDDMPDLSDDLHWVVVTTLSNEECRLTYGNQIHENMVCAEGNYNEGLCIGDTGGALVQPTATSNLLAGIASFVSGNGCESTDPSGYIRVYPYTEWIRNITTVS